MISTKTQEEQERVDCLVDGIVRVATAGAALLSAGASDGSQIKLRAVLDALCDELLEQKTEARHD